MSDSVDLLGRHVEQLRRLRRAYVLASNTISTKSIHWFLSAWSPLRPLELRYRKDLTKHKM